MKRTTAGFNKKHERINRRSNRCSGRLHRTINGVEWLSLDSFRVLVEVEWPKHDSLKYSRKIERAKDIKK